MKSQSLTPTPSHLTGIWQTPQGIDVRFVSDVGERAYSVRSPNGIHLRSFSVSTTPDATESTLFDVTADEYQLANKSWEDDSAPGAFQNEYLMIADRATNPSIRMQGGWNMLDENGTILNGPIQMGVSFSTQNNNYFSLASTKLMLQACGLAAGLIRKHGQ